MKKSTFRVIAMTAMMVTLAAGCQKEHEVAPQESVEQIAAKHVVEYVVDGERHTAFLYGDEAWRELLHRLFLWAEEGHRVSFRNAELAGNRDCRKEVLTYTTSNQREAEAWALAKEKAGYEVSVEFDKTKGIYTCTAVK